MIASVRLFGARVGWRWFISRAAQSIALLVACRSASANEERRLEQRELALDLVAGRSHCLHACLVLEGVQCGVAELEHRELLELWMTDRL